MNVLLISIDTLSAKHLGCYGYHRTTSPNLDRLAVEGVLFDHFLCAQVPTQPSYTSIFTGQFSVTHSIVTHGGTKQLAHDAPYVTWDLQKANFTTAAVSNLHRMQPWFARGFEFLIDPSHKWKFFQSQSCEAVNQRAVPWLKSHADEPFFLFVHYWDPHTPYLPPERYRGLFYDGDPCDPAKTTMAPLWRQPFGEWWQRDWFEKLQPGRKITDAEYIVAMYDSEIRYVDEMGIAPLLAALDEAGLRDDTLVMVVSDHGEMMYDHGIYFDHHGLYDENLHVPLIVRWPGRMCHGWLAQPCSSLPEARRTVGQADRGTGRAPAGRRVPHLVVHADIAATILDACGCPPHPKMEGRSLLPLFLGKGDEGRGTRDGKEGPEARVTRPEGSLSSAAPSSPAPRPSSHSVPAGTPVESSWPDVLVSQECTWQAKWAIRTERHKYIKKVGPEPDLHGMPPRELYDLASDPEEHRNLASAEPDVADLLDRQLSAWLAEMVQKNGLSRDPLVEQGITLGKHWHDWVEKKRYW